MRWNDLAICICLLGVLLQSGAATAAASLEPTGSGVGGRPAGMLHSGRSPVMATGGMAATSDPLATQVAVDILQAGGSAVDAAIAANAVLSLVMPYMCGPGGDLFAILWDPEARRLQGLNASGRSSASLTLEALRERLGEAQTLPYLGPLSVTVPGAVDGWFTLHERYGRLPMAQVLAPAVRYARQGVPTMEISAQYWSGDPGFILDSPDLEGLLEGFRETYLPQGRAPQLGELWRNPDLADFLETLGGQGRDYFYRGAAAQAIATTMAEAGGSLTREDLAAHRSDWVTPVSVNYRGYDVYEMPPNGQGIAALQMLTILEGFDLGALDRDSPELWHLLVEAKKLAYEDRARHYADPDFMTMPVDHLISEAYGAERRKLIDPERAMASAEAGAAPIEDGDTVYLTTADADGLMVSLIQSVAGPFGSGLVAKGLGFTLQNRAQFSLEDGHPNVYAPGKRPFHTIIPAFVTKDGEPWLAFGVMGGGMQPQGHVQVLVNLIDFGMDLQDAGDAARFRHVGSSGLSGRMEDGGRVLIEPGITRAVLDGLRERGHQVELSRGDAFGGYQAITRNPKSGVLTGATEMRKDGAAAGF